MDKSNGSDLSKQLESLLSESLRAANDSHWFLVRENIFAIPYLDGYILYSPLQGLSLIITNSGLGKILLNKNKGIDECLDDEVVKSASGHVAKDFGVTPFQSPKASDNKEKSSRFKPRSLTLSLTSACQLACKYCYINGGDNPKNMPKEIVEASIEYVSDCLKANGIKKFEIEFHGQGEPTANWPLFIHAVNYASKACIEKGLEESFSIVTNGILTENKIEFLAEKGVKVGLSLDGLKESTDIQRPLRKNGSSFNRIMESISLFKKHGIDIGIRSTVTDLNLEEMGEFTKFIANNTDVKYVNFEPVCFTGRATNHECFKDSIIPRFINKFRETKEKGVDLVVDVAYSAARTDGIRSNFCGAYGNNLNFCVSTDGLVSSCYEVLDMSDIRSELFIYGRYNFDTHKFVFHEEVLERLITLNVNHMKRCTDCYAKWNCGGDCISKVSKDGIDRILNDEPIERCAANRALIKDDLIRLILTDKKEANMT